MHTHPIDLLDLVTPVSYRSIEGFPGYRIGDDGSVWSCLSRFRKGWGRWAMSEKWHQLTPRKCRAKRPPRQGQYRNVLLSDVNGTPKNKLVHVLVLVAFRGPPLPGQETRHMDGNPANNRLENLEWGTKEENLADVERHGTRKRGIDRHGAKLTESEVQLARGLRRGGMLIKDIADRLGNKVSKVTLSLIFRGKKWAHLPFEPAPQLSQGVSP